MDHFWQLATIVCGNRGEYRSDVGSRIRPHTRVHDANVGGCSCKPAGLPLSKLLGVKL